MRESLATRAVENIDGLNHPHTGDPIVPLGFRRNGSPIWPIMGASEDDGGADETEDESGDEADESGDGDDDGADDEDARKRAEVNAKAQKHRLENRELKQKLADLEAKVREFNDKDKDEQTRLSESNEELQTRIQAAEKRNEELTIRNAFLESNSHKWKNPKAALRLADLSKVEIDDEGEVSGLKEALDALAKSDPYLLAGKDDEDDETPATGQPPKTKKSTGSKNREALERKYPALRRG